MECISNSTSPSKMCRLCLTTSNAWVPIFPFAEVDSLAISLSIKIKLCTTITVSQNDNYPKHLCLLCLSIIKQWYNFRTKCQQSQSILKRENPDSNETRLVNTVFITDRSELSTLNITNDPSLHESIDNNEEPKVFLDLDGGINSPVAASPEKINDRIKCEKCPDSFTFKSDLQAHEATVHFTRSKLSKVRKTKRVDSHILTNAKSNYKMTCCGSVFSSKSHYRHHLWKKHPGEKPFACEICGKKDFISEETLRRHKILHSDRYACTTCGRTFTCHAILRIHVRDKHEHDRPFVCDVCGKAYVTELLLSYHQRFHTGEKKYVCEECGVAVATSSSLAKHRRTHSEVKPHICGMCGKGFIVRGRLIEHIRVHTGERPFVCQLCAKAFTMQDKLKRHLRLHTDHKPYSCEVCGNAYTTNHGLTIHQKSHSQRNQDGIEDLLKKPFTRRTYGDKLQDKSQPRPALPGIFI